MHKWNETQFRLVLQEHPNGLLFMDAADAFLASGMDQSGFQHQQICSWHPYCC